MSAGEKIEIRVTRRDGPEAPEREETFLVDWQPTMNVLYCLMEIQRHPVQANGQPTSPVAWESNCLEEVCGSCTMVINGKVQQGCTALVDKLEKPIRIEPMQKYPLVRDLVVDRHRIFDDFKKAKAWVPIDGSYDLGPGPRVSQEVAADRYHMARCMSCGCCMEVCPQYGPDKSFMGAATMNQVVLMNAHPTGALNAHERLDAMMGEGGIQDCGNAQACVHACPKEIPLTDSIASLGRQTTVHAVKKFLSMGMGDKHAAAGPG
jgi:succinate dehydrogenase / fumarate reductase iron-sulfur subunit